MHELGEFVRHYPEFKTLDVQILAISTDPISKANWVKERIRVPFPILSDSSRKVMELYGTRSPESPGDWDPEGSSFNTPTLVVIDKRGTIRWIHQSPNDSIQPPVQEVLAQVRNLK